MKSTCKLHHWWNFRICVKHDVSELGLVSANYVVQSKHFPSAVVKLQVSGGYRMSLMGGMEISGGPQIF